MELKNKKNYVTYGTVEETDGKNTSIKQIGVMVRANLIVYDLIESYDGLFDEYTASLLYPVIESVVNRFCEISDLYYSKVEGYFFVYVPEESDCQLLGVAHSLDGMLSDKINYIVDGINQIL